MSTFVKFDYLSIGGLSPNPLRPRTHMSQASLLSLADSIRRFGVLTPIVVAETAAGNQIIAGERRWRAAKLAGLDEVPVVVYRVQSNHDLALLSLVENIHRDDLNLLDQAQTLERMVQQFRMELEEIAETIGLEVPRLRKILSLLELPEVIKNAYLAGNLPDEKMWELLEYDDPLVVFHEANL